MMFRGRSGCACGFISLFEQGGLPEKKIWSQIIIGEERKYENFLRCEIRGQTDGGSDLNVFIKQKESQ